MKNIAKIVMILALIIGIFSVSLRFMGLHSSMAYAAPAILYVAGDESCGGNTPCYTTIQAAVDTANSGDEIRIAAGTYTSSGDAVVVLDKSLTLKGGYPSDFSDRDVNASKSMLDGENNRRGVSIDSSGLTITLDGLHITRGNNESSSGGGVRDTTGDNTLTLQNCQIYQNVANISGGGVFIGDGTTAVLTANSIYSNTAQGGDGGGVAAAQGGALTMTSSKIYGNLVDWDASGGGVAVGENRTAQLAFNQIYDNRVGENGGGISVGSGSVITITYNTMRANESGLQGTAYGGGIYLYNAATATLTGNTISANIVVGRGGGIGVNDCDKVVLANNTLLQNRVTQYDGGGIYITQSSDAKLENNLVGQNSAVYGGGIAMFSSPRTTLAKMTIYGNTANGDGGGLYVSSSNGFTLRDSRLYGNSAQDTQAKGGGLAIESTKRAKVVNTVIADNVLMGQHGAGLAAGGGEFLPSEVSLIHTTLARNTGSDGSGVYAGMYSSVMLINTILVSQTFGVYADADGAITLTATLWGADAWSNDHDYGGASASISSTHNYTGTPNFLNTANGDYHIGTASAARNKGVDTNVTTDIDGERRPFEGQPDLGADELAYSLEISKDAPATADPGDLITYTLTITNNGYITVTNIVITDALPAGVSYVSGGTLVAPRNIVSLTLAHLAGGQVATRQFAVTAMESVINADYGVTCDEGVRATGLPVTTNINARLYLPLIVRSQH